LIEIGKKSGITDYSITAGWGWVVSFSNLEFIPIRSEKPTLFIPIREKWSFTPTFYSSSFKFNPGAKLAPKKRHSQFRTVSV
jgi:hypothetical protein